MSTVAFLGLGRMGHAMASRLLAAGHDLVVYNRTADKGRDLVGAGARRAESAREAATGADAVFAMVADDEASRTMWLGGDGALAADLAPQAFAVECSTLSHGWVAQLWSAARQRGLRYLDCPVTGLPAAAAEGQLTLLIGAEDEDLRAADSLLQPLAANSFHFGPPGAGTAYKLMINLMGAVQIAAVAEGMAIAERAGLDLQLVARAISTGQAASPQVIRNSRRMADGDHDRDVVFSGRLRHKDVTYAMQLARELDVGAPLGETALAGLDRLLAAGLGEDNESRVIDVARRAVG